MSLHEWPTGRARHGGVDEVPLPGPAGPGRLWLCGKHFVGPDPEGALHSLPADTIVCLCERYELEDRYPDYVSWLAAEAAEAAAGAGGQAWWFPIPDLHAPSLAESMAFLDRLHSLIAAGRRILMHCGAGIGRAGTMAAGLLMTMGASREEALATVAQARPLAGPEAGAQAALLEALGRALLQPGTARAPAPDD